MHIMEKHCANELRNYNILRIKSILLLRRRYPIQSNPIQCEENHGHYPYFECCFLSVPLWLLQNGFYVARFFRFTIDLITLWAHISAQTCSLYSCYSYAHWVNKVFTDLIVIYWLSIDIRISNPICMCGPFICWIKEVFMHLIESHSICIEHWMNFCPSFSLSQIISSI